MGSVYKRISRVGSGLPARAELGLSSEDEITSDTFRDLMLVGGLTKGMNSTLGALIVEEGLWNAGLELARSDEKSVAFRASWALEWAYTVEPLQIERRFETFFRDFLHADSESVQRVYSKMLCDMLRRGAVVLKDDDAEAVAERCFELLTADTTPVSVKVWQIELLYDLIPRFDWIGDNLTAVVRTMSESPECTPALAAHARHYFNRLRRDSQKRKGRSSLYQEP